MLWVFFILGSGAASATDRPTREAVQSLDTNRLCSYLGGGRTQVFPCTSEEALL